MNNISQTTFSNVFSSIKMFEFRLKFHWSFVPKGPINNIPALVQIMAWRCSVDKPLSEPMMVSLPTHICVDRPQWVKQMEIIHQNLYFEWACAKVIYIQIRICLVLIYELFVGFTQMHSDLLYNWTWISTISFIPHYSTIIFIPDYLLLRQSICSSWLVGWLHYRLLNLTRN